MRTTANPLDNHILRALSREARERLFPHLVLGPLPLGLVLSESGQALRHIYFPTDAILSLLNVMQYGASAEIAVVGNEGAVGMALFMGGETSLSRAVVQSAGHAYRLSGSRLKQEFNRHGEMLHVLLRYTQSLIAQMAQTAVCNRHHSVDQQLCRWLLMSLDRLAGNDLVMTQNCHRFEVRRNVKTAVLHIDAYPTGWRFRRSDRRTTRYARENEEPQNWIPEHQAHTTQFPLNPGGPLLPAGSHVSPFPATRYVSMRRQLQVG